MRVIFVIRFGEVTVVSGTFGARLVYNIKIYDILLFDLILIETIL